MTVLKDNMVFITQVLLPC